MYITTINCEININVIQVQLFLQFNYVRIIFVLLQSL